MPTKGGRRVKEKRLRFQIKTAINSNNDPYPHFQNLAQLLTQNNAETSPSDNGYLLQPLEINYQFPDYRVIQKSDPRRRSLTRNVKVTCTFEVRHEKPVPIALRASRAATANRAKLSTVRGASSKFQVDSDEAGCDEGSNLSVSLDPLPQFAEQRRLAGSSKFSGGQICILWT
ncbi:hypothetical protein ALC56_10025 [Trachymyrmex septentrionalis]|uniref:Uncharacterized protein n=1 Tax=Trachymyrmex septentrionalis TaxID=34720 RepID=A0A195F4S9_9HYME|nr:hypothetical protein ALC56_10025 [Trachymyrmex septentrionalis]